MITTIIIRTNNNSMTITTLRIKTRIRVIEVMEDAVEIKVLMKIFMTTVTLNPEENLLYQNL